MWPPRFFIGNRHSLGPGKGAILGLLYPDKRVPRACGLVGKARDALARLIDLQQTFGAIGIKLNIAKCRMWSRESKPPTNAEITLKIPCFACRKKARTYQPRIRPDVSRIYTIRISDTYRYVSRIVPSLLRSASRLTKLKALWTSTWNTT